MSVTTQSARQNGWLQGLGSYAGKALGAIIITAGISFEMFNYSTTDYALRDLLGGLAFFGVPWSTTLTIAFCAIDFAGLARLFMMTPDELSKSNWYLFGAWMLSALMNAMLTWWGVAMAILTHPVEGAAIVDPTVLTTVVPVFVALLVWVIRILLIGAISAAGGSALFGEIRPAVRSARPIERPLQGSSSPALRPAAASMSGGSARTGNWRAASPAGRGEVTYQAD